MATLLLAACSTSRSPVPVLPVPATLAAGEGAAAASPVAENSTPATVPDWWRLFGSAELDALIDRGLAHNPDLRVATIRLAQAAAFSSATAAGRRPTLTLPLGAAVERTGSGASAQSERSFEAGLRGEWRPDLWGEQVARLQSANWQVRRAALTRRDLVRQTASAIASRYIEYLSLNDRLRVAREVEAVLRDTIPTIENRLRAGDATLTELEQQKAAAYSLRATIPGLALQREEARNALGALLGADAASLRLSDAGLDSLRLPASRRRYPSSLLRYRTDIQVVEARLQAAAADLEAARAKLFPTFDLSAHAGYASAYYRDLFDPVSLVSGAMATLVATVFDGGRREGERRVADAAREEMVEEYARAVYQSLREVEGALSALHWVRQRLEAQSGAAEAAKAAWESSRKAYQLGGLDHLGLLDTERNYYRYLDDFHGVRSEHLRAFVRLFTAFGVGVGDDHLGEEAGVPKELIASAPAVGAEQNVDDRVGVAWHVELPGLFHHDALSPLWRDLGARHRQPLAGTTMEPAVAGRFDGEGGDVGESWYRVSISGFARRQAAADFCARLAGEWQRCEVVARRLRDRTGLGVPFDRLPPGRPPA